MKNVKGTITDLSDSFLDAMRRVQDPPADAVAVDMVIRGDYALFADLVRQHKVWEADGEPSLQLPDDVRRYLKDSSTLPSWLKPEVVRHGEEFFLLYGVSSATLLACASLPECYLMRYGTEVLCFTKFLQLDPARRIRETAQMIMSVMCPGGLVARSGVGIGVRSTQKVRVMHATIRCMIARDPGTPANPSDVSLQQKMGAPINQEDLAFTLMTFSYVAIRGFKRLGVPMTRRQQDAYVHCWNVVGFLMGVNEELLPDGFDEAEILYNAIVKRQAGQSAAGQRLTKALMDLLERLMPPGLKSLPTELTRRLVGPDTADLLALPRAPFRDRVLLWVTLTSWRLTVRVGSLFHRARPYRFASESIHKLLLDRMGNLPGHAPFNIPPEFIARWLPGQAPLVDTAEDRMST